MIAGDKLTSSSAKPHVETRPPEPVKDLATRTRDPASYEDPRQRVVIIACKVLQAALARVLPEGLFESTKFMDYGLHRVPTKLTGALQEVIDEIEQASLVVLGYGLCGNGLKGVRTGEHTLLVPRADDCIAILLGSYRAYMREFGAVPGTYYLTKGWLESGSNPLQEYEECTAKYGPKEATWILDQQYQHYERLALVASDQAEMEAYRPQAKEVARFCERWGMRYEEILGSDDYMRRLVEAMMILRANDLSHPFASPRAGSASGAKPGPVPDWLFSDFLVIPPGGEIRQEMFMR